MEKLMENIYYTKPTLAPLKATTSLIQGDYFSVLVDSGAPISLAEKIDLFIQEQKLKPLKYLILTHHHYDHIDGIYFFKQDLIMLEETKKLIDTKQHRVFSFEKEMEIDLGNDTLVLKHIPTSHTKDHLVVYAKKAKVIFVADALQSYLENKTFVFYEKETKEMINMIRSFHYNYMVTGHQGILSQEKVEQYFNQMLYALDLVKKENSKEASYEAFYQAKGTYPKTFDKYFIDGFYEGMKRK